MRKYIKRNYILVIYQADKKILDMMVSDFKNQTISLDEAHHHIKEFAIIDTSEYHKECIQYLYRGLDGLSNESIHKVSLQYLSYMKYIISESKINSFIYDYLSQNYIPKNGWSSPESYSRKAINYNQQFINKDGDVMFVYIHTPGVEDIFNKPKSVLIWYWVGEELDSLFSDLWILPFKNWFEGNTGLPVNHVSHI